MKSTQCKQPGCGGAIVDGECQSCHVPVSGDLETVRLSGKTQAITTSVRALLEPAATESTSDELIKAASSLAEVVSDDWHKKADLLVAAIHRLQTKEIAPDQTIKLLGVPLQENKLRDAAEAAFRNCADFAETDVDRIALIDAANEIRRQTWF